MKNSCILKVNAEGILLFSKRDHDITEIVLKMAFNTITPQTGITTVLKTFDKKNDNLKFNEIEIFV